MLKQFRASLGVKIIVLLGIILVIVFSIITYLNFVTQKKILLDRGLKQANALGDSILTGIRYPMLEGDQDIIQYHFDNFRDLTGIKSISLLDNQGIIKRSTDIDMLEKKGLSPVTLKALIGREAHGIEEWKQSKRQVFTEAIPIFNEQQCMNCHGDEQKILGVLNISLDWQPVVDSIESAKNLSIIIALIGLVVISMPVIFILLKFIIQPNYIIENGLKKVSEGDLQYKLPVEGKDEIARVSKMFNQMTRDISNFVSREKELRYAEQLKSRELAESLSLINATFESTADGILVVDNNGIIRRYNRKFLDIWNIPEASLKKGQEDDIIAEAFQQVENLEQFKQKVEAIYLQPNSISFDILKFKNGKIVERESKPQKVGSVTVGRVWSFRDITEQNNTEQALKNKMQELETFNRFVVGREIKMKELKEEIADLKDQLLKDKPLE
ncbi:MAG: PAS-domain containing protein [Candidatus Omnitrophica bacterium]|nr:PAS-domain containing protein [Candidatus Omnitrophota bacterium]